ncbi:hypothetical protein QP166_08475 [Sphingomonas sp. LR60]|uniref:hypothetical protein n=1 Tax=Sphingomonas sp. LR60 TaxID=3050233 RepID=UPI002FE27C9F
MTEELGQPCGWPSFSLRRGGVRPGAGSIDRLYDPANTQNLGRTRCRDVATGLIDLDLRWTQEACWVGTNAPLSWIGNGATLPLLGIPVIRRIFD